MFFYTDYNLSDKIKVKGSIFKIFSYKVENHNDIKKYLSKSDNTILLNELT